MAIDFGVDIACAVDLGARFARVTGLTNLGNAVVRRLSTPHGALAAFDPDAADYGLDVRGLIGENYTPGVIRSWQTAIANEIAKDERLTSASVSITPGVADASATITILATLADGKTPFQLIIGVTSLTVALLNIGAT